jgi:hypothetical protein
VFYEAKNNSVDLAGAVWYFVENNFDEAWKICKKHEKSIQSKSFMKSFRPGVVAMLLYDLYSEGKLNEEDRKKIGKIVFD